MQPWSHDQLCREKVAECRQKHQNESAARLNNHAESVTRCDDFLSFISITIIRVQERRILEDNYWYLAGYLKNGVSIRKGEISHE